MGIHIAVGFAPQERDLIADLYWQAFGAKLSVVMGPPDKGRAYVASNLDSDFALVARNAAGSVLGVAGFKTAQGAMVGGEIADLAATFGWLSCLWRVPLLAMVDRDIKDDVLLMDGICVTAQARGQGVGTLLLTAIKGEARKQGKAHVRLDVIDTNPRAKALYERQGFVAQGDEHLGPFSRLFGFNSATKMIWTAPVQNG